MTELAADTPREETGETLAIKTPGGTIKEIAQRHAPQFETSSAEFCKAVQAEIKTAAEMSQISFKEIPLIFDTGLSEKPKGSETFKKIMVRVYPENDYRVNWYYGESIKADQ